MIKNNLITKIQHAWVLISILNEIQKIFPEKEKYPLPLLLQHCAFWLTVIKVYRDNSTKQKLKKRSFKI